MGAGRNRAPPSTVPAYAGMTEWAQAGTHPTPSSPPPIHPSPLLGGRLGGGWEAPSVHQRPSGRPPTPHHHSRPLSVIPAQAGTAPPIHRSCLRRNDGVGAGRNPPTPNPPPPFPNSSLPPFRGRLGGGWEPTSVQGDRPHPNRPHLDHPLNRHHKRATPIPLLVSALKGGRDEFSRSQTLVGARPPSPSFLRRQERWMGARGFLPAQE